MMKSSDRRITLYNHKGGVGKTTLSVNVGAALAARGERVFLVDSDPQCNLTSYFFPDEFVNDLLNESDGDSGRTIWSAVRHVVEGVGGITPIEPYETVVDNLEILPGDIRLSEFEQALGDYWTDCFKRRLSGLRATTALSALVNGLVEEREYSYVLYDTGPNIGPLNRAILLDCDYFVVPVACDLFSVRALATLGQTLKAWILDWQTISDLAPDGVYLPAGRPKFLGYIPQRFQVYGRAMAQAPSFYLRTVQKQLFSDVVSVLKQIDPALAPQSVSSSKLGQVKDFGSIVQIAQSEGVPLENTTEGSSDQAAQAGEAFRQIAARIVETASFIEAA